MLPAGPRAGLFGSCVLEGWRPRPWLRASAAGAFGASASVQRLDHDVGMATLMVIGSGTKGSEWPLGMIIQAEAA